MISLCITTYNRFEMLMESFAQVLNDDWISEIVIVDDCSDLAIYDKILAATFDMPKVRLIRNGENLGMSLNKKKAIEVATNEWVCIFDSDNMIGADYLDALQAAWRSHKNTYSSVSSTNIYCPSFAKPQFDYRHFTGNFIAKWNIPDIIDKPLGETLLNTCNYVVNREEYLKVYQHNPDMKGTDTIWFNYLWLKAGNSFYVVPGMEYMHRVWNGSGFLADCEYNMRRAMEIKQLIKLL